MWHNCCGADVQRLGYQPVLLCLDQEPVRSNQADVFQVISKVLKATRTSPLEALKLVAWEL